MRPRTMLHSAFLGCTVIAFASLAHLGCDNSSAIKEPSPNAGTDAGNAALDEGSDGLDAGTLPDGAPKDCFDDPKTHFEIINACTTATRVPKAPTLSKLLPDGGLPPLQ